MWSGWQITRGKKRPGQKAVREVPETRKSPHSSACKAGCTPTALWASFSTWIYKRNKMKPSNNRALCDSSHNTMCVTKEKAFVCIWLVSMNHSGHKDFHQPLHHLWRSTDVPPLPVYLPVWAGLARRHRKLSFTLHRALDLFCFYFILSLYFRFGQEVSEMMLLGIGNIANLLIGIFAARYNDSKSKKKVKIKIK